jgi:hypothetical protein
MGDYFPRKIAGTRDLERDPSTPAVDETGDQLLKHARVYTLADTLQLPALQSLASSKIHCVNSTAKGEIAYARYVYAYTQKDDSAIRAPVVNFWAMRSHTLRAEAEDEFRMMCLEFPQFGYDVLSEFPFLVFRKVCLAAGRWGRHGGTGANSQQRASWTRKPSARRTRNYTPPAHHLARRASGCVGSEGCHELQTYSCSSSQSKMAVQLRLLFQTFLGGELHYLVIWFGHLGWCQMWREFSHILVHVIPGPIRKACLL